jgi:hypothetical protein
MREKNPGPLRAGFWLNSQEKGYILVVCLMALIGLAVRYFYLKSEQPEPCMPPGVENLSKE